MQLFFFRKAAPSVRLPSEGLPDWEHKPIPSWLRRIRRLTETYTGVWSPVRVLGVCCRGLLEHEIDLCPGRDTHHDMLQREHPHDLLIASVSDVVCDLHPHQISFAEGTVHTGCAHNHRRSLANSGQRADQ